MDKKFLKYLLSQPTAPYRESHVIRTLVDYLAEKNVPYFRDPIGNIIVGVGSQKEYVELVKIKTAEPLRIFMAHMDHPGFHGVKWIKSNELLVKWYGGTPRRQLNGTKVWIGNVSGVVCEGIISKAKLNKSKTALDTCVVKLKKPLSNLENDPGTLFGAFHFLKPVWEKNSILYTKAADDLVGCFAVVSLAAELKKRNGHFIGVLTRAEEVGFVGAIGHFELGWLRNKSRPILCISLETSRQLPGAEIGKGPVVRLGDRATVFHSGYVQILTDLARQVLPKKYQRRIMDGGTCEATAATVFGIPSIGISIPLGNYHNQSFEGGPQSRGKLGAAPEFVHLKDIEGMLKLCHALMERDIKWQEPWAKKINDFRKIYHGAVTLLKLV